MSLQELIKSREINYNKIKENSQVILCGSDVEYDYNVIIGCRGRTEFMPILHKSFEEAMLNSDKKICFTVVEHSTNPEHRKYCIENNISYLFTTGNITEQYSRSFAYNFGFLYSNKAKYYIMHDLDILVKSNFFNEIEANLSHTPSECMQTYGGRRVLYMNQEVSHQVIFNKRDYNTFTQNTPGISLPMYNGQPALGSKGGSILISRELFAKIGGFDPELFWGYAAEDQFFWHKAEIVSKVTYADNPLIDMFHMWHPPSHITNPHLYEMENQWCNFRDMKKKDKLEIIELKKSLLTKHL